MDVKLSSIAAFYCQALNLVQSFVCFGVYLHVDSKLSVLNLQMFWQQHIHKPHALQRQIFPFQILCRSHNERN